MKLKAQFLKGLTADNGEIEITFTTRDRDAVRELKEFADTQLSLTIGKYKEKRTLDANAYFWVLAQRVAETISAKGDKPVSAVDVYKQYIRDIGMYEIVPIKDIAVKTWTTIWQGKGLGWIVEDLGASKHNGYTNLKCHYGSSAYNQEQMSRLIDMVKADCDELGIETKTPDELAELKSLWKGIEED